MTSSRGDLRSPVAPVPRAAAGPPPGPGGSGAGLGALARRGALSLAGSAVSAGCGVLLVLAVTRTLPKDAAGVFFALTSVYLIAETVARLGTGTGLVWAVSRTRALGLPGHVPGLLRVALPPVVATSLVLALALVAWAEPLAGLLSDGSSGDVAAAIRILAVLLPLTVVAEVLLAAGRGFGAILPTVAVDRVGRSVLQVAAVAAVAGTGSLAALATAWAAPWVVAAVLAGWWLARLQRRSTGAAPPGGGAVPGSAAAPGRRQFWSFTGPRALTSVVQLALQRLDIVLLTLLAGPVPAAIYTAATRFLVVGQFVNQALATVVEPRLGRLLTLADPRGAGLVYRTATGWLVLLSWPVYLLAASWAGGFLDWFGAGYDAGVPVVLVLSATMLMASAVGMVDVVLIMGGRTTWNLGNALVALAVNVAVDVALIPSLGLLGAAVGWSAAIGVKNLLALAQVWHTLGLHPFGAGTATAIALSVACFGVPAVVVRGIPDGGVGTAAAATVLGVVLYGAGCWRYRQVLALDGLRPVRTSGEAAVRTGPPAAG